jgi:polysaccharide export outer membrane protein
LGLKNLTHIVALLLACYCLTSSTFANETNYRVGPGDVLQITVTGEPDFSGSFTVRYDNTIFYSYVKSVNVEGMTSGEIADRLTTTLGKDYITNPTVNVMVKEFASKSVKVLGAVIKPGSYILKGETRLLDIVTMAGGLAPQAGSNITIVRTPKIAATPTATANVLNRIEPIVVNYSDLVSEGKLENNILLEPDDVINVPKGNEIFVLGQVVRPGAVPFSEKVTLLQAISVAGGPSPAASTKSAYIIRKDDKGGSKKINVRLDRIMEQKEENIVLFANDVIVIPESFF